MTLLRESLKLVVFDMDGVLVDTESCHREAYTELWRHVGIRGPSYRDIAGRTTREVVAAVTAALKPDPETLLSWVHLKQESARRHVLQHDLLYDDVLDSVNRLAKTYRLALATGGSRDTVEFVLRRLALAPFLEVVVTADDVSAGKPAPESYVRAMNESQVDPGATLVVEDSSAGLQAGLSSGAKVVSVRSGAELPHPRFLGHFRDLTDMIDSLGLTA